MNRLRVAQSILRVAPLLNGDAFFAPYVFSSRLCVKLLFLAKTRRENVRRKEDKNRRYRALLMDREGF
jgi:hypothetical protein